MQESSAFSAPVMRGMSMSSLPALGEVTGNIARVDGRRGSLRPQHNNS